MQASINGIKMAFDDIGKGPAVILVHGFPFNRKMWAPQISFLAENGFRVIAPDLRGFGESEVDEKPFRIRTFSDDICRLMKHLGIGRAALVGMSMGGEVVLDLLRRYSRKVVATTILAPMVPLEDAKEQFRYLNFAELVREGHRQTAIDGLCQWFFPQNMALQSQDMVDEARQFMEAVDPQTLANGMTFCAGQQTWMERGEQHNVPSLVLTGEKDHLSPPRKSEPLAKLLPLGRRQVLREAGHMLNIEAARELNQSLLGFLQEVNHCKPGYLRLAANRVKTSFNCHFLAEFDEDAETESEGIVPI
jgi:pimeloyl-ACP methyl ester carboxylesterase